MLKGNFVRETLKKGQILDLPEFVVKSLNSTSGLAVIVFVDSKVELTVPFCFPPLGISQYGADGYMQPELLPYTHTGFIMDRNSDNKVRHRSSAGEWIQMKLDRNFDLNGEFVLLPVGKEAIYYTSMRWKDAPAHFKEHCESWINRSFKSKGSVYAIRDVDSKVFHSSLLLSKVTTNKRKYTIFMLFEESVIYPIPGEVLLRKIAYKINEINNKPS